MAVNWNALYGYAQTLEGQPYLYGGTGQGGFDCSGFTQAVYARQGVNIGRTTVDQFAAGQPVGQDGNWANSISQLQPGDLIFYGAAGASGPNAHVVMYIGNNQVIQAGGTNVNVTNLFQSASPTDPFMGIRRYTQIAGAPAGGASGAAATGPAGNTSAPSAAPSMADIPALDAYIKENFPTEAWLLDIPAVKTTLEQAVSGGLDDAQVQASMQQTSWWQHTSQAMIAYDKLANSTPEELNFNNPGSKASGVLANVMKLAGQNGTNFGPAAMQKVAMQTMEYGWSDDQITQQLGSMVKVSNAPGGGGVTTNDPQILAQLTGASSQYLYNPGQAVLNQYAQAIAGGKMTMDTFNAFLAQQASTKYPSMAEAIKAGQTPQQIIDPLRTEASNTLEVPAQAIDFISDPTFSKILNYTPPPVAGKAQAPRVMSTSEMDTYLRGTTEYGYTQGARNNASDLSDSILKTFGKAS